MARHLSTRLALATRVAEDLRRAHRGNVLAVGVCGSVAIGRDRAHSDVDLVVIVRGKQAGLGPRFVDGTLVSVLALTPEEAREEVAGPHPGLPEVLAGWRTMRPLYDPRRFLRRYRARSRRPTRAQWRAAAAHAILSAYEDYGKVLNAAEAGEADELREVAIWFSGAALSARFCLEGHVVRTGREMFSEARRLGRPGQDLRALRYGKRSARETARLATRVWRDLVARGRAAGLDLGGL
jgi:predicted nucleotidyltransferase